MKVRILIVSFFIVFHSFTKKSTGQEIFLDHLICVVSDIDSANSYYSRNGFTIKNGYLHENGLLNSHIKFTNNSSLELISVKGDPSDEITNDYIDLLKSGEGGVFVAISGIKTHEMIKKLTDLEIKFKIIKSNAWNYITFPKNSSFEHFFFIDYKIEIEDSKDLFIHKNGSEKFKEIFVEGDEDVINFLKGIGIQYIGEIEDSNFGTAYKFITNTGDISVISKSRPNERPRIKSISFDNKYKYESFKIIY